MNNHDIGYPEFMKRWSAADGEKQDVIALFKDNDGNWRGGMYKDGKFVEARQVGPETVLQMLLTHDGKN